MWREGAARVTFAPPFLFRCLSFRVVITSSCFFSLFAFGRSLHAGAGLAVLLIVELRIARKKEASGSPVSEGFVRQHWLLFIYFIQLPLRN